MSARPRPGSRLRDHAFAALAGALMGIMGLVGAPIAAWSNGRSLRLMKAYDDAVFVLLRWMTGIRIDVRGAVPDYPCIVAAKHQSQLDVYILFRALPHPRFIMKASLARVPIFGFYTRRVGCIAVERGRPGEATRALGLLQAAEQAAGGDIGQIVVYPQGTRIAPGAAAPYKRGAAIFAEALDLPIVPVAVNTGVFWSRDGRLAGPGTAVVSFLEPLPRSLVGEDALGSLEQRIEEASAALLAEAGGA
ncbi:MAG: lysophospholipid acyltransferase family protein [Pseudomonadota bacterium]